MIMLPPGAVEIFLFGGDVYICKCWVDIHLLDEPGTLKEKRRIIRSLKDRIWNRFRVSVAEVGAKNLCQRAEMGIAFAADDGLPADRLLQKIINLIDSDPALEIVDIFQEVEKLK
jgi:hypothetical protein